MYIASPFSWDNYYEDAKNKILDKGTHAIIDGQLTPLKIKLLDARFGAIVAKAFAHLVEIETGYGTWYRSKERIKGIYPFKGPQTTKNWFGNEVCTLTIKSKETSCKSAQEMQVSICQSVRMSVSTSF